MLLLARRDRAARCVLVRARVPGRGEQRRRPPRARRRTASCRSSRRRSRSATCPSGSKGSGTSPPSTRSRSSRRSTAGSIDVLFNEGQHVKKGDLLVQIDPRPFAIALQSAAGRAGPRPGQPQERAAQPRSLQDAERAEAHRRRSSTPTSRRRVEQLAGAGAGRPGARSTRRSLNLDYAQHHVAHRRRDRRSPGRPRATSCTPTDATGIVVVTQLDPIAVLFTLPQDDLPRDRGGAWRPATLAGRGLQPRRRQAARHRASSRSSTTRSTQATATMRLKAIFDNPKPRALAEPVRQGAPAPRDAQGRAGRPGGGGPARARRGRSPTSSSADSTADDAPRRRSTRSRARRAIVTSGPRGRRAGGASTGRRSCARARRSPRKPAPSGSGADGKAAPRRRARAAGGAADRPGTPAMSGSPSRSSGGRSRRRC